MSSALLDVDKIPPAKARKERERIQLIEAQPREEWLVQTTDQAGRLMWFLRLQITGLRTRRYGPFPTKHRAMLFLDRVLDLIGEGLAEAMNCLEDYQIPPRQFANRPGHYPVVEDELVEASGR